MLYYKVRVITGHMGDKCGDAFVYIKASNIYTAMGIGRNLPGVKSERLPDVEKITKKEYYAGLAKNKKDGYLRTERIAREKASNILEQRDLNYIATNIPEQQEFADKDIPKRQQELGYEKDN